uniref:Uncharacterized protein n=1 Tax=Romanomermis culicivorax TaxID=13658 RepID=A0A915IQS4_ROMCU
MNVRFSNWKKGKIYNDESRKSELETIFIAILLIDSGKISTPAAVVSPAASFNTVHETSYKLLAAKYEIRHYPVVIIIQLHYISVKSRSSSRQLVNKSSVSDAFNVKSSSPPLKLVCTASNNKMTSVEDRSNDVNQFSETKNRIVIRLLPRSMMVLLNRKLSLMITVNSVLI